MPFRPVTQEKLSHAVVSQIEKLILRGILRPGERLPAERELAERLGVSRPSLRDAISQLQIAGLLSTKPGAGIYVADVLGSAFSPALTRRCLTICPFAVTWKAWRQCAQRASGPIRI